MTDEQLRTARSQLASALEDVDALLDTADVLGLGGSAPTAESDPTRYNSTAFWAVVNAELAIASLTGNDYRGPQYKDFPRDDRGLFVDE